MVTQKPDDSTHFISTLLVGNRILPARLEMISHPHTAGSPDNITHHRIFLLQSGEVLLSIPVPDTVTRKQYVNLLERALVSLWVKRPNNNDCKDVDAAEDVQCLFVEAGEDRRQQ